MIIIGNNKPTFLKEFSTEWLLETSSVEAALV